jgi:hypothetical protein
MDTQFSFAKAFDLVDRESMLTKYATKEAANLSNWRNT